MDLKNYNKMKKNKEKFKQFVIEQLKDYDEWREASPDGYAEIITDEAVKLFCQPDVMRSVCCGEELVSFKTYGYDECCGCGTRYWHTDR